MLVSLDLFTGIAGITHALRGIATPAMYCEVEPTRLATLEALMTKGLIPRAPIHTDVRTLTGDAIPAGIDMVAGGWPCRGWSPVGKKNGFEHEQSALFFEFARIVNEIKPKLIFQENVPAVVGPKPIAEIAAAFPDYDMAWLTLPAYAVGGKIVRMRWYCLGIRKDVRELQIPVEQPYTRHTFDPDPCQCMVMHMPNTKRLSMLGNSVVPDAVRLAFLVLLTGFQTPPAQLWEATCITLARPPSTGRPLGPATPFTGRRYGSVVDGVWERQKLPPGTVPPRPDLGLVLVPFARPPTAKAAAPEANIAREPIPKKLWAAPLGGNLWACSTLTRRNCGDLYTQIRFEKNTPDALREGYPNTEWVEHLMGFPRGWTESLKEARACAAEHNIHAAVDG
jgi:C-5 cytosine-specific DNA methylase